MRLVEPIPYYALSGVFNRPLARKNPELKRLFMQSDISGKAGGLKIGDRSKRLKTVSHLKVAKQCRHEIKNDVSCISFDMTGKGSERGLACITVFLWFIIISSNLLGYLILVALRDETAKYRPMV